LTRKLRRRSGLKSLATDMLRSRAFWGLFFFYNLKTNEKKKEKKTFFFVFFFLNWGKVFNAAL
jgi:hypothetical protein